MKGVVAPRRARRVLEQHRQERALGLSQRQPPGQREPELGLSLVPELNGASDVDASHGMDQTCVRFVRKPASCWYLTANRKAPGVLVGECADALPKAPRAAVSFQHPLKALT